MTTKPMAATLAPAPPTTPYVALICTAERLVLRDDFGTTLYFNLNISTAVVADTAEAVEDFVNKPIGAGPDTNLVYLRMWAQTLQQVVLGSLAFLAFDVFTITGNTVAYSGSCGLATPDAGSAAVSVPCASFLDSQLSGLIGANQYALLCWQPAVPSNPVDSEAPGSIYQPVAWRNTVAHASTWPRPIPQGLKLSFEVGVPWSLIGVDSVLIYPRFVGDAVDPSTANLYQPLQPGDPWNSYAAKYANSPRWAYQAPCPVKAKQSVGLVDPGTYWILKDAAAAGDSTSDWRQRLEATIGNRFDYLPRLLGILPHLLENLPDDPTRQTVAAEIWKLGLQMLKDLSTIGADPMLEGTTAQQAGPTIQYTLLLRAFEAIGGFSVTDADTNAKSIIALLPTSPIMPHTWIDQMGLLLQGLDQQLAAVFPSGPAPSNYEDTVPTLQRLYSIVASDENLVTFLWDWWDALIPSPAGQPRPNDWGDVSVALKNQVLPPAQLHNRYLSAIAAKSKPLVGSLAPPPVAALGLPLPGRSEHSAIWSPAANDSPLAGQMIVFAGYTSAASASQPLQDTWVLNAVRDGSWSWNEAITNGAPPAPRRSHSAVFDTATAQMLLFGGFGNNSAPLNDLYSFTTAAYGTWMPLAPTGGLPPGRGGHTAVYDQANSIMTVFGGGIGNSSVATNEVWVLSNANGKQGTPAWTRQTPTGNPPSARLFHSTVYDLGSNRMIVFAGTTAVGGAQYNDVWILTNANGLGGAPAWISLAPAGNLPPIRNNHSAVYDAANNRMIVFGGQGNAGTLADAWVLSNANGLNGNPAWSQLATSGGIKARWGHTAVYNPGPNNMLIFSGAEGFVPDFYTLSNANGLGGAPAWTQGTASGLPQLDASVRAAVAGWVLVSATAAQLDASFISSLTALVVADVNDPQNGLTTVAPVQPTKTKRPQPVVIQVGGWSEADDSGEDVNEDLRRYAGVGVLVRTRNLLNNIITPWRCINAANITASYGTTTTQIESSFVASRLHYRNGMKDPFVAYDNQPLIATSPAAYLQGQFVGVMAADWAPNTAYPIKAFVKDPAGHKQECTQAGTSGTTLPNWNEKLGTTQDGTVQWTDRGTAPSNLLSYSPATGSYGAFYGLIFGTTFEFAPFAISHGGAMPKEIEASPGVPKDSIQFDNADVIRQLTYLRRVPVGHLRVMSGAATSWSPNNSVSWPVIPPTVYPLVRDLLPPQGPRKDLPLLLLPFVRSNQPLAFGNFKFQILPPATDINTWDRWVADGSVYDAGTSDTRKAVWAAFHRESSKVTGTANAPTNQIGDAAVVALRLQLDWLDLSQPIPTWTPMPDQTQWVGFKYNPVTPNTYDSVSAWKTVNPSPTLVNVANGGQFQLAPGGSGGFNITVPKFSIARFTVDSLVADGAYTSRFEPGIFNPTAVTVPPSANPPIPPGKYQILGSSFSVIIECPDNASTSLASLLNNLTLNVDDSRTLQVTLTNLSNFQSVGVFEIQRQDWRWLGRPLPDLTPSPQPGVGSQANTFVYDPSGHRQECVTAGISGLAPGHVPWNDAGGTTQDGSIVWSDQGFDWKASTAYALGAVIIDSARHVQICIQAGTSGPNQPAPWTEGGKTPDGTVIWSDGGDWTADNWEEEAFVDRSDEQFVASYKRFSPVSNNGNPAIYSQSLASIDLSNDRRCQYIRFSIVGHNRYEDMQWFQPAAVTDPAPPSIWHSICVPRDPNPPQPPKPLIRLVLPLLQRTNSKDGTPQADLLVIADENWYRIGGLGETLAGQIQPVLGTENTTILGPLYEYTVGSLFFNRDAGVVYLDSGVAFELTNNPTAAGQYSVTGKVYTFSSADAGQNVAISFLELDANHAQRYEFGPDQIVSGWPASSIQPPQVTLAPWGATLEDTSVQAPNFTDTYFSGSVSQSDLASWNHFKVQFRRELRSYAGAGQATVSSDWTDPMWVQTVPDSATFKKATGTIPCGQIKWKWTTPAGQSTISLYDGSGNPLQIVATSPAFMLWLVATQTIFDAFGNEAEVYFPPTGGTSDKPQFSPAAGQTYNLRIVEVQRSPATGAPTVFDDSNFMNTPSWEPQKDYQQGQIIVDSTVKHIRQVTVKGQSGPGPQEPTWAPDGQQTKEPSGLTWDDEGVSHGDEMLRVVRISPSIAISTN